MKIEGEGKLLRIFIGEADRFDGKPLYQYIVNRAREGGLAGATVIRGLMGFGAHSRMHTAKLLRLSEDLPIIIELVDTEEKIRDFVKSIDGCIEEGMITMEKAEIISYRSKKD